MSPSGGSFSRSSKAALCDFCQPRSSDLGICQQHDNNAFIMLILRVLWTTVKFCFRIWLDFGSWFGKKLV